MKGDFSRFTHAPEKHYTQVLKQQGRVDLDADWNEYTAIQAYLGRIRQQDLIGLSGVPLTSDGFRVAMTTGQPEITPGHIYVDGILCQATTNLPPVGESSNQPYYPNLIDAVTPPPLDTPVGEDGFLRTDLVYLDVHDRHITVLEDPALRETALGGPDTTTRVQTVWRVRITEGVTAANCDADVSDWLLSRLGGGWLTNDLASGQAEDNPCVVSTSGGGYRAVENRLYRVEIHQGGIIGTATFKWSRDNGAIAFTVASIAAAPANKLTLTRLGPDQELTLHNGDWVEIISEMDELLGQPGQLVQIKDHGGVNEDTLEIEFEQDISAYAAQLNVKVRRWDSPGQLAVATDFTPFNDGSGIQVKFGSDVANTVHFRNGDYWLFAARTITGAIDRLAQQPPHGVEHHTCKLALVRWSAAAEGVKAKVEDCRPLFPRLTELLSLNYVSGAGQEIIPGAALPKPLVVRVNNGEHPVAGAKVEFSTKGGGNLKTPENSGPTALATTGDDGLAQCVWKPGKITDNAITHSQQVEAVLYWPNRPGLKVRFNANLVSAKQVRYKPQCDWFTGLDNVQAALDKLCDTNASQISYNPPDDEQACPQFANKGIETVKAALDELCSISDTVEPGIKITGIFWEDSGGGVGPVADVINGGSINLGRFSQGLSVYFNQPVEQATISRPTCFVTVDIPHIHQHPELGAQGVGYQTITLAASLTFNDKHTVVYWQPFQDAANWLRNVIMPWYIKSELLTRLTLKGNFIWQANDPTVYLDGEAYGTPPGAERHNLRLPSGNDRRGGDFELWFWLQPDQDEPPPVPTGEIRWSVEGANNIATLDPVRITDSPDKTLIDLLFAGLVRLNDKLQVIPDLAASWEMPDDLSSITFRLRSGLRFSDASPITAPDVKFSLERGRNPANGWSGPVYLSNIGSVSVVDDLTINIKLKQPSRFFLHQLTTAPAKIISEKAVLQAAEAGIEWDLAQPVVTSGPFMVSQNGSDLEWQRGAEVIALQRNPNYYYWEPASTPVSKIYLHCYESLRRLVQS